MGDAEDEFIFCEGEGAHFPRDRFARWQGELVHVVESREGHFQSDGRPVAYVDTPQDGRHHLSDVREVPVWFSSASAENPPDGDGSA
jgi:hypothetical protein